MWSLVSGSFHIIQVLRIFHNVVCINSTLLFITEQYFIAWAYHMFISYSFILFAMKIHMQIFVLFAIAIPMSMKWYVILVLICSSLIIYDVEHLFCAFINHLYILFAKMLAHIFCSFSLSCLLTVEFQEDFSNFGYKFLIKYIFCKYFLLVCCWSFHFF